MNNDNRDKFFEDEQGKIEQDDRVERTDHAADNRQSSSYSSYEESKPYSSTGSNQANYSQTNHEQANYNQFANNQPNHGQANYNQAGYNQPSGNQANYNQASSNAYTSNSNIEDAEYTSIDSYGANKQEAAKPQGPTYYAYGQTRPMQAVQAPYNGQYGEAAYNSPNGAAQQPSSPGAPYRAFTTSNGGDNPFAAKKEKKRAGGFGKMFLSFMAGVVAVGLLMYTADSQNWFSKGTAATQGSSYTSNSGSSSSNGAAQGKTSSLMMDRPDNISELFNSSSPAVVKIETYSKPTRNNGNSLFNDPFFRQFFGNDVPDNQQDNSQELEQSGMGTGFFFDSTGYILTNQHVIADATEIRVVVEGYDEPFVAKLLGASYELDLAVLKVEGEKEFPTLPLGNSNDTQIGDWVLAIGNPYGFDHTLTVGVISAKGRPIDIADSEGTRNYENLLQTDASINPGNSGGPLLNMNGEVIGINTAVSSTAQGIGFAIPTSTITEVLEALKNNEAIPQAASPFIGVDLQDLTENLATQLGLSNTEGAIVRNVYYNSPAYKGGMKQYDVVTAVDGNAVKTTQDLIDYIKEQEVGKVIELSVIRDGKTISLPIEIGDKNQFSL